MVKHAPLVSVVIPVWNGAAYLAETIGSVLMQGVNVEIVAVNDGSTDNSCKIISSFACRLVSISHSGIAKACNTGLQHSSGDYLMLLDQDDILCESALYTLLEEFLRDDALQVVAAMAQDFVSPDIDEKSQKTLLPRQTPYYGQMSGCVLLRQDALSVVGSFNEVYNVGQAVDYMLRINQTAVKRKKIDFISVLRRLHANNTGRAMRSTQYGDYSSILRSRLTGVTDNE